MLLTDERQQIVELCQALQRNRLVVGTAGNISIRVADLVAISPSGIAYGAMTAEQVGVHRLDGEPVEAPLRPSSEFPLHLAIYHKTSAAAIVHTHGVASTALSTVVDDIPASHYYTGFFGGTVRVAPYATFGTAELAHNVVTALRDRTAALMANHGAVTIGTTPTKAYERVEYLEYVCDVHLRAVASGLHVRTLPGGEVEHVAEKLVGYGQGGTGRLSVTP